MGPIDPEECRLSEIRIILVDDHNLVRSGLRALLDSMDGVRVIGEADGSAAALDLVRRDPPDIVMSDISMKGMDGIEFTAHLKLEFPLVRVIILSMHSDEHYVQEALRAGAASYLLKDAAGFELEFALHAVMRGEAYLSPAVSRLLVDGYAQGHVQPAQPLTTRQREILSLIAGGFSTKQIAFRLAISGKTVEAHRGQIMERLQIRDIAGLVKYALSEGLTRLK
jgi:DNA-binding NarL/FixJ family response regulator